MENTIERISENTVMFEHVFPHETIGDLTKRARLEGSRFRVSITLEKEEIDKGRSDQHPLAVYLENNHPFSGLSDELIKATREIREGMNERLFR